MGECDGLFKFSTFSKIFVFITCQKYVKFGQLFQVFRGITIHLM